MGTAVRFVVPLSGGDSHLASRAKVQIWTGIEDVRAVLKLQGLTHLFKGVFAIGLELQLREESRESNRLLDQDRCIQDTTLRRPAVLEPFAETEEYLEPDQAAHVETQVQARFFRESLLRQILSSRVFSLQRVGRVPLCRGASCALRRRRRDGRARIVSNAASS